MRVRVVLLCFVFFAVYNASAQGGCIDLRGRHISHGLHYVPGPDTCTLCICDNGLPKVCKAVLCSPPQDCRSFRVGNTCCEFICLDDVVKPVDLSERNFRMAAVGAGLVVILTIALIVYRVKRKKLMRAPLTDDQRSLTSIGYISGSIGYIGGTCETSLSGWKPPGHYLPRGEAPPPYDEAMAQSREHNRLMMEQYHRSHPALETMDHSGSHYANLPRPQQQVANPQGCFATPLLQSMPSESQPSIAHHPIAANLLGLNRPVRLTGSLGAIAGRALGGPGPVVGINPNVHVSTYYAKSPALHRTIPRIPTAESSLDGPFGFSRERSSAAEIRRSFHRPAERYCGDGRSMPRRLDTATSGLDCAHMPYLTAEGDTHLHTDTQQAAEATHGSNDARPLADPHGSRALNDPHVARTIDAHGTGMMTDAHGARSMAETVTRTMSDPYANRTPNDLHGAKTVIDLRGAKATDSHTTKPLADPHGAKPITDPNANKTMTDTHVARTMPEQSGARSTVEPTTATSTILPLTVDKPSCVCSYSEASATGAEEADDYRSECENCKATSSSRWVVEESWPEEEETQTLQRRAPAPAPPPPATATLPQRGPKQPLRLTMGPSNWDNWFSAIPDTDSESEGE